MNKLIEKAVSLFNKTESLIKPVDLPFFLSYFISLIITSISILIQIEFMSVLYPVVFILLYPAVFFSGLIGGFGPGLLSSIVSAFGANFLFIGNNQFKLDDAPSIARTFLFLGLSVFISLIVHWHRNSYFKLREASVKNRKGETQMQHAEKLANIGSWTINRGTRKITGSNQLYEIFDTTAEDHNLSTFREKLHPEDRDRVVSHMENFIREGKSYEIKYRIITSKGVRFLHSIGDYLSEDNIFTGVVKDITEQILSHKNLEEALRARDEFISIASHELKTPLTTLKLQSQMSKRSMTRNEPDAYSPERVNKLIDTVEKNIDRLNRLVDDMLDISRIRSGKLSFFPENCNLYDIIFDVVERMNPSLSSAGIKVYFNGDNRVHCTVDRHRIEQVITNLMTNAARYGDSKPISIDLEAYHGTAIIRFKDQGIGLAKEDRQRIFKRFERAISANEVSGLGLGLYITEQIVLSHGGKIWVESDGIGKGSTFFVQIPSATTE